MGVRSPSVGYEQIPSAPASRIHVIDSHRPPKGLKVRGLLFSVREFQVIENLVGAGLVVDSRTFCAVQRLFAMLVLSFRCRQSFEQSLEFLRVEACSSQHLLQSRAAFKPFGRKSTDQTDE